MNWRPLLALALLLAGCSPSPAAAPAATPTPDLAFEAALMCNDFFKQEIAVSYPNLDANCLADQIDDQIDLIAPAEYKVTAACQVTNRSSQVESVLKYVCHVKQVSSDRWQLKEMEIP